MLPPDHRGEILREEYLLLLKMDAGALAKKLNSPRTRIERIAAEPTPITTDTALRLASFGSTSGSASGAGGEAATIRRDKLLPT